MDLHQTINIIYMLEHALVHRPMLIHALTSVSDIVLLLLEMEVGITSQLVDLQVNRAQMVLIIFT